MGTTEIKGRFCPECFELFFFERMELSSVITMNYRPHMDDPKSNPTNDELQDIMWDFVDMGVTDRQPDPWLNIP